MLAYPPTWGRYTLWTINNDRFATLVAPIGLSMKVFHI
jgi:hypothetical protein